MQGMRYTCFIVLSRCVHLMLLKIKRVTVLESIATSLCYILHLPHGPGEVNCKPECPEGWTKGVLKHWGVLVDPHWSWGPHLAGYQVPFPWKSNRQSLCPGSMQRGQRQTLPETTQTKWKLKSSQVQHVGSKPFILVNVQQSRAYSGLWHRCRNISEPVWYFPNAEQDSTMLIHLQYYLNPP